MTIWLLWYTVAASPRCKQRGTKKINYYVLVSSCGSGFLVDYNFGCPRRLTKDKHFHIFYFQCYNI